MADAEAQARWRARVAAGELLPQCQGCEAKLRADSAHVPLCSRCWRKTEEGKAYLAQKQMERRKNHD